MVGYPLQPKQVMVYSGSFLSNVPFHLPMTKSGGGERHASQSSTVVSSHGAYGCFGEPPWVSSLRGADKA